ncbi:MAG: SufD family Fe-S cluster assembly protein [Candidatus Micrarchaeota archaeon]|nr:SufD family Fe-S cluster assembly protein [Candidatus Micrarchaeota archaeon]
MNSLPIEEQVRRISYFLGEPQWLLEKRLQAAYLLQKRKGKATIVDFEMTKGEACIRANWSGNCAVVSIEEALRRGGALREQLGAQMLSYAPDDYLLSFALFTDAFVVAAGEGESKISIRICEKPPQYFASFFLFEDGASSQIVVENLSGSAQLQEARMLAVGNGACVEAFFVQNEKMSSKAESGMLAVIGEESKLKMASSNIGCASRKEEEAIVQQKQGSRCERYEISVANKRQKIERKVRLYHLAKKTFSRMVLRYISAGSSTTRIQGGVSIDHSAAEADTHFAANALMLSNRALCHISPQLYVHNNQVLAGHGSTVSTVDEDQLFYLQSRGIKPAEARKAIVEGFAGEILNKIGEFSKEKAERSVSKAIEAACKGVGDD